MGDIYDNLDPVTNPTACCVRDYYKQREAELQEKLEAAEARIKASQEQEPIYEVVICGAWAEVKNRFDYDVRAENERRIRYKQPIIPPDLAELQQELKDEQEAYADTNKALNHVTRENAELQARIAELEAVSLALTTEGIYGRAKIAELEKDAGRYQWLKLHGYANEKNYSSAVIGDNKKARIAFRYWCQPQTVDELIDAAMKKEQAK